MENNTDENFKNSPLKKSAATARKEYIHTVADKIQSLITNQEFMPSDIMVLVQRRNPFAAPLINELKSRNIDVAGSDRIILPEFPAIRDLLNLVRFCIDNGDDYSLCCTLKSPIYRLNEDDILNICNNRTTGNLFEILANIHPDIYQELSEIIECSKSMAPYSFFSHILNTHSRREKMIAALGNQIIDPLEEFLTICLSYERTMPGTLKHFLKWFITGASEIKRDMDANNGVRIVTVHGSKGLEAPVVFLVDTARTPKDKAERIFAIKDDAWLWSVGKSGASEELSGVADDAMNKKIEEYYRLLYVAMTRARDRLYVYGFTTNKAASEISWHNKLNSILSDMPGADCADGIIRIKNDRT